MRVGVVLWNAWANISHVSFTKSKTTPISGFAIEMKILSTYLQKISS